MQLLKTNLIIIIKFKWYYFNVKPYVLAQTISVSTYKPILN